ncbi:chloride channel protein [Steroidobacter flavus]|uniref:Chloride channel protein n=1 Tax=Steroidobacter flavus TaxID=1842136 RepID=A0ABV8SKH4_9GAMM
MKTTSRLPHLELADFRVSPRLLYLVAMAAAVGGCGLLAAWGLVKLIALATNLAYFADWSTETRAVHSTTLGWGRVLIPAAGGIIIGLMARFGSEKIRGHGIPEAIEAILMGGSRIQPRVAILKPLSSAISIGSGGPFGAEGPVIMTGGALGSLFGQLFHLTSNERKTLLVAGAAAGMTGIFGTPLAAILLAVELLLFEWRPRSFLPVAMAAVVSASLRPLLFETPPLFPFSGEAQTSIFAVGSWIGIGVLAGLGSAALTALVYGCEDAFQKLPLHWMWWPAIGGLIVGLGGLIEPHALGVGYDTLQSMLDDRFTLHALVVLMVVKAVIWSVALGSGTSGGVLAPLLIMGGALGALVGKLLSPADAPMFALLGMAAMMGGTMRSPLTATIFGIELTGNIHALLPLVAACAAAHCLTVLLLKRSILTERIARRGHHLTREYSVDPFELVRVKEVMVHRVDTLPATMTAGDAIEFFSAVEHRHKSYPLVDANGTLVGMVSRTDTLKWIVDGQDEQTPLSELSSRDVLVAFPDELVGRLADRMAQEDVGRMPVVRHEDRRLIGIVSRKDLLRVRAALLAHDHERSAPLRA